MRNPVLTSMAIEFRHLLEKAQTERPFPIEHAYHGTRPLDQLRTFQALIPIQGGNEGGRAMLDAARHAGHCAVSALSLSCASTDEDVCAGFEATVKEGSAAFFSAQREADIVAYEVHLNQGCPVLYGQDPTFTMQVWRDQVLVVSSNREVQIADFGPLWNLPRPSWWPHDAIRTKFSGEAPLCLLSYSSRGSEEKLAEKIYRDFISSGIQCWKWNSQARLGKRMIDSFSECLDLGGVVLLISSKGALGRQAVLDELEAAHDREVSLQETAKSLGIKVGSGYVPILHAARIDGEILDWTHPLAARFREAYVEDLRQWETSESEYYARFNEIALNIRQSWSEVRALRMAIEYKQNPPFFGEAASPIRRPSHWLQGLFRRVVSRFT